MVGFVVINQNFIAKIVQGLDQIKSESGIQQPERYEDEITKLWKNFVDQECQNDLVLISVRRCMSFAVMQNMQRIRAIQKNILN